MSANAKDTILARTATGLAWMGSSQIAGQVLHVLVRLLLARLLVPEDFGLMAMAVVLIAFAELFFDLGLGASIVQREEVSDEDKSTAFWAIAAQGVFLGVGTFLCAPLVGWLYRAPDVVPIVRALSLKFFIGVPSLTYGAFLQRDMDFRALAMRRLLGIVVGGVVAIVVVYFDGGVWALVAYTLTRTALGSVLLMSYARWLPSLTLSPEVFWELWSFGINVTASRFVNYFRRNMDTLIVGRYLGASALGLYAFGYQAVMLPLMYLVYPANSVAFSSFSRIQDDRDRCQRWYLGAMEVIVGTTWPLCTMATLAAPTAVLVFLGDSWAGAVVPFQLLACVGAVQACTGMAPALFKALGRPELDLRMTILMAIANLVAMVIGLRWGVVGVAAAYLVSSVATLPVYLWQIARLLDLSPLRLLGVLRRGILSVATLVLVWVGCERFLGPVDLSVGRLIAYGALAAVVYAAVARLLLTGGWSALKSSLRSFRRSREYAN